MTGFDKALNKIKENKAKIESGGFNCIPFGLDRFEEYVPGILQGTITIISANSGIGKSQLTKNLYVRNPISFIKNNPDKNIKLKIFYFALEEREEEFYNFLIAARLKKQFNIIVDPKTLLSYKNAVTEDTISKIEETRDYFKHYTDYVEVIDYIYKPYEIFKYVREYARNHGKFYFKGKEVDPIKHTLFDTYVADDPDEYVLVVTDHISLLQEEQGMNLHQTMGKWSSDYCRKQLTKHYNYAVINVQQQGADSEKKQFTFRGDSITAKIIPSLDGLANNKETQRDAHLVLGLFAPDRHDIEEYLGYNIEVLSDKFRTLHILKNRIGIPNKTLPLYFNGATNEFKELPKSSEMNSLIYQQILNNNY